jgi:uncharacterized protein YaaW (UPF0174 family)
MTTETIYTLDLLSDSSDEDLEPLVEYILKASTEGLTGSPQYKRHKPYHSQYADSIYREIRLFGGNSFANAFRHEGPRYSEILKDAAKKVGVKDVGNSSIVELEQRMIQELLRKATKETSGKEREDIEKVLYEAGLNEKDRKKFISGVSLAYLLGPQLYRIFMGQVSGLIANAVAKQVLGHGLRVGAGAAVSRWGGLLLGPVGWIISGVWAAADIAGPAYRVTVPCTLHIAMLRQQWLCDQETSPLEEAFND